MGATDCYIFFGTILCSMLDWKPDTDTRCGREHVFGILVFSKKGGAATPAKAAKTQATHNTRQAAVDSRRHSLASGTHFGMPVNKQRKLHIHDSIFNTMFLQKTSIPGILIHRWPSTTSFNLMLYIQSRCYHHCKIHWQLESWSNSFLAFRWAIYEASIALWNRYLRK